MQQSENEKQLESGNLVHLECLWFFEAWRDEFKLQI